MYVALGPDELDQDPRLWGPQPGVTAAHAEDVVVSGLVAVSADAVCDCVLCVCALQVNVILLLVGLTLYHQ